MLACDNFHASFRNYMICHSFIQQGLVKVLFDLFEFECDYQSEFGFSLLVVIKSVVLDYLLGSLSCF